ncbi:hypothetical protein [Marinobacter goseongensis]|uniref:hypothetical protein n=1 Tax=Marinobacter goseongensis TaxID=453838 RepID=UPI00200698E9|nr:hypothetical protein [Marinobacter goseongensis]MCK7550993.1 hypothetical protein [Marinobacter goseongensis]
MKKFALLLTLAITSVTACAQADQVITAVFSGMKFQVPGAPVIIGALGQSNDILLIKFSNNPGERYISFSAENSLDTGGCEVGTFFEAILEKSSEGECEKSAVESFQSVFVKGTRSGAWKGEDRYYYFLSDSERSFVFFRSQAGHLVKLESDFLEARDFRALLGDATNP